MGQITTARSRKVCIFGSAWSRCSVLACGIQQTPRHLLFALGSLRRRSYKIVEPGGGGVLLRKSTCRQLCSSGRSLCRYSAKSTFPAARWRTVIVVGAALRCRDAVFLERYRLDPRSRAHGAVSSLDDQPAFPGSFLRSALDVNCDDKSILCQRVRTGDRSRALYDSLGSAASRFRERGPRRHRVVQIPGKRGRSSFLMPYAVILTWQLQSLRGQTYYAQSPLSG